MYDELSPLLLRMQRQREELAKRMQELTENKREFAAVTAHMREGMVLLSGAGDILSINESAAVIFGVDPKASSSAGRSSRSTARWRWKAWWSARPTAKTRRPSSEWATGTTS